MDCRGTRWNLLSVITATLGKADHFVQMVTVLLYAVTMRTLGVNVPRIWTKVAVIASLSTA